MGKRLALIIGNSLYRDKKLSQLMTPDADIGELTDILLDPGLGGFDDVKSLVNTASHIVRREIFNFFSKKSHDDLLLFYFSGHGVLDDRGRLYLALKDTDTEALRGTAIPAGYITDEMDSSRSKRQVLILDCCHSGAFGRGSKGATGASVGIASTFEGSGYGRVVLTASDATQYAWEGDQVVGEAETSLFTHFLVKGIHSGEADANSDGQITLDELYDYAYSQILEKTPKQSPGKWSFKEQGELIIARNPKIETHEKILDLEEAEKRFDDFDLTAEEEKKKRALEDLYSSLLSKMIAGKYHEAKELITKVQTIEKGYKDTDSLLLRVDTYLQEEEKRRAAEKAEHSEIETESKQVAIMVQPERKLKRLKYTGWKLQFFEGIKSLPQRTLWISVGALVIIIIGLTSLVAGWPFPISPTDDTVYNFIPAGEFQMGSEEDASDGNPVHTVYLDAFWIGQTEVTNAQYKQCVEAGPCQPPLDTEYYDDTSYAEHPVVYVDWFKADAYCEWVGGHLPTDAQWEKAARGGLEDKTYPWGDESPTCTLGAENGANYFGCYGDTFPVGSFAPNGYELYDMAGNVWEYVAGLHGSYENSYRILRGGSRYNDVSYLRAANRVSYGSDEASNDVGFRCALSEQP